MKSPTITGMGNITFTDSEGEVVTFAKNTEIELKPVITANEYQKLSTRTINHNLSHEEKIDNMVYGIVGEVGEVVDLIKKSKFQGHELNKDKLKEEIGDVMFYIANLCTFNNILLEDVLEGNVDKLKKRYPDGFKVQDSINRVE